MKKIVNTALAAVLCAGCFAGFAACGKDNGKIKVELGMWPEANLTQDIAMYRHWKEEFEKENPEYEIIPSNYTYNLQSFISDADSGVLPTVFQTWMTEPPSLIESGYIRDITDQLEELGWIDKLDENMIANLIVDNRIYGVVNRGDTQYVLLDTPGFHKARNRLGDYMVKVTRESIADVDAVLLLVEPVAHVGIPEAELIEKIKASHLPAILCINKIDTVEKKDDLLAVIAAYREAYAFDAIIPISARTHEGLDDLMNELGKYASEGPQLFPDGMTTDQPDRQVVGEIVREKLLRNLDKEIPHGTAVEITRFIERDDEVIEVDATIYCEKASHKGIIIGKNGAMLKKISTEARRDIERFMGTKVYLETWVKVKENWRDNMNYIRSFGYDEQ